MTENLGVARIEQFRCTKRGEFSGGGGNRKITPTGLERSPDSAEKQGIEDEGGAASHPRILWRAEFPDAAWCARRHSQTVSKQSHNLPGKAVICKELPSAATACETAVNDPYGTRTRVAAVKGRSPRPLDEGAAVQGFNGCRRYTSSGVLA